MYRKVKILNGEFQKLFLIKNQLSKPLTLSYIPNSLNKYLLRPSLKLQENQEIYGIISEEHDDIYKTKYTSGKYIVAFDPLDGSSNIEFNITTGTIFAIYKLDKNKKITSGRDIVVAGYCLYGAMTQFVHTDTETNQIMMFRLNEENQKAHRIEDNIIMPHKGKYILLTKQIWINGYFLLLKIV